MDDSMSMDVSDAGSLLPASLLNKKVRRSRAQLVVETARSRSSEQANVQNLPSTRIEHGNADGKPTLTAIFPKTGGGKPQRLDISFLLEFPGLTEFFAAALLKAMKDNGRMTRINVSTNLRRSWFAFLGERGYKNLDPEDLDEQILNAFNKWLHEALKADGKALHPVSISHKLGALRGALAASSMPHLVDLVPPGPRGAQRKLIPTEVLQFDQLLAVIAAVEKEVLVLRDNWEKGQNLLMRGRELRRNGAVLVKSPYSQKAMLVEESNLAVALAMLDQRYPGVIPDQPVIRADNALLGDTIQYGLGTATMTRYFYATGREIVPLALSIAIATVFNPNTILKLKWKNIDRNVDPLSNRRRLVQFDVVEEAVKVETSMEAEASDAAESPLAKITGDKPRAGRQLVRLLDPEASGVNQVNLNMVLDLLSAMTERIRPFVIEPETYGDRIFLYIQTIGTKRAKGFGGATHEAVGDEVWRKGLANFIKDNNLPEFTLKTIRATMLDYVQLFNRGDLEAARQVGNHISRVTTWTHYTSNLVKRLLQEATGEILLVRERWLDSGGKIDPRKHREWASKGCATPGWICLDPFDSPRPNQKHGRLCSAYGECPDCPLAAARPINPRNVMLYEALRRAIYRSITRVTPPVWQDRWAPVVSALDGLMANVPEQILEESRKHIVELPDIG
jgi:hypothetical protein